MIRKRRRPGYRYSVRRRANVRMNFSVIARGTTESDLSPEEFITKLREEYGIRADNLERYSIRIEAI